MGDIRKRSIPKKRKEEEGQKEEMIKWIYVDAVECSLKFKIVIVSDEIDKMI